MPPAIFCQTLWELSGWLLQPVSFFSSFGFFGLRTRRRYHYPKQSVLHANMCRLYSDHHFGPRQSYLMAACIKTIKLCPSPATTIICGCVGWNLARNYHFLNHFTLLALCLFHSFSSSISSLSSLKDLEPLHVLLFASFLRTFFHHYPTALFFACKCFLNAVLSSLSGWMSLLLPVGWVYLFRGNWCVDEWGNEVHPHLAAPLPEILRQT